ncbi:MAG: GNAT family N-acetyltransferase [Anaerolineae bacterium]|nr:GNAT family N-acetyltransferase [Anaerolineae bacterium]
MTNVFQGAQVRLRAVEVADWEVHYDWNFDSDNGRFTDEVWFPSSREQVRAWAEREAQSEGQGDAFCFQIERLDGTLVGTINTHGCNPRCGTFRYGLAIRPEHRRQGYASEAIRLVLRYYFDERRYQKVNAEVYSFNEPSMRLHERLGFTLEGRLRRVVYTQGQFFDALIYGMTREEFDSQVWRPSDSR